MRKLTSVSLLALGPLLLTGCAAFSPDQGMDAVAALAGDPLKKDVVALNSDAAVEAAQADVKRLLAKPLTADAAVQVALLNNRDLQADYNVLGSAEAARIRASLLPNPRFSLSHVAGGGGFDTEAQVVLDILALATLPVRSDIADDRFRQAQLRAALATLRVASEARRAYIDAVAARDLARFLIQAQDSAESAVKLATRLGETGAMNKLDQARNQVFYAETTARLASARRRESSARERLVRAMGLWGGDLAFRLPSRLPALPGRVRTRDFIEVEAVRRRVDLQAARLEVVALGKSYGLTKATRFLSLVEASGNGKRSREPGADVVTQGGGGIELEVPLFDFGETNLREAEAKYTEAVNRLTAKAVNVRSEAREAYQSYHAAYDIARHYQREVLPLRKIISDEMLLRYNAMQIDVFSLLAEARERINSTIAGIEAERAYWLADAALVSAVIGGGMANETAAPGEVAVSTEAQGHD